MFAVAAERGACSSLSAAQRQPCSVPAPLVFQRRSPGFSSVSSVHKRTSRVHAVDGGVIDRPQVGTEEKVKNSNQTIGKKPPIYKVLLHNDNFNRREYVVKVLLKVVDALAVDDAVNVMQEAHLTGVALVIACGQDQAESYVEGLRLNGLVSTLEPGS